MSNSIDLLPHLIRKHNPEGYHCRFEFYDDGSARIVTFPGPAIPGSVLITWDKFKDLEKALQEIDELPIGEETSE